MRLRRLLLLLTAALPVACATQPLPDAARIGQFAAFGGFPDAGLGAISVASWAFADPARTRGDPVDAARAAAAVDYLAGDLYASPRWVGVNPLFKQQMLGARGEVRGALGIAAGARSQSVVDGLLNVANAMAAGDQAATDVALRAPVFALGPQRTYQLLLNLPFLPLTNVATQHLNGNSFDSNDNDCRPCG